VEAGVSERAVKPLTGSRPAGVLLLLEVLQHAELATMPAGPWVTDAETGRLMDPSGAVWHTGDDGVQRTAYLPCGCCAEVTAFRDGAEISRAVGAAR
jgi:hypothetical protein